MNDFEIMDLAEIANLDLASPVFKPAFENAPLSRPALTLAKREGNRLLASVSVFHDQTPVVEGKPTATLGHIYAENPELGLAAIKAGLSHMPSGRSVLGPMDANTWFPYRAISDFGDTPPFFLEKPMASFWPDVFKSAGFTVAAAYRSSMTQTLDYEDRSAQKWEARLTESGITIRRFDVNAPKAVLKSLYDLSLTSFAHNLYYTPIDQTAFMALYQPALKYLVPDFVWLAFDKGECVGFVFAMPDLNQSLRGETVDTLIIKTLAVKKGRDYAGLGAYLGWWVHQCANAAGYKKAIHAYMYEGNTSRVISDKSALVHRRYELYRL